MQLTLKQLNYWIYIEVQMLYKFIQFFDIM